MLSHLTRALSRPLRFAFCSEPVSSNILGDDRATNFYRNSIRRININERGRGKFTQHNLLRLTKLIETSQQQQLLLEAFYNYIGHFTLMDNATVDKMLLKIMSLEDWKFAPVLALVHSHCYLGYFPHYRVTNQLLLSSAPDQENQNQLVESLIVNPLIKFNQETVDILKDMLKSEHTQHMLASRVMKLLIRRQREGLIDGLLSEKELVALLAEYFQRKVESNSFRATARSSNLSGWLEGLKPEDDQGKYEVSLVSLGNGYYRTFGDFLDQVQDQALVDKLVNALEACAQKYKNEAIDHFAAISQNEARKERLNSLKSTQSQEAGEQEQLSPEHQEEEQPKQ